MKKIVVMAFAMAALSACDSEPKFKVEGEVTGAEGKMLYLEASALEGIVPLDSVKLNAGGAYTFKEARPESPEFYRLRVEDKIINFSVDSTETVRINAGYDNFATDYTVEGSPSSEKIKELSLKQLQLQNKVDELRGLPNVVIKPPISGLSAYLSSFDYIFMPSVHEGLATLSIEASQARTPVLANKAPGLTDTLPDDWPLMVDNNDTEQWLHLFNSTLTTIDITTTANAAQQFARRKFAIDKMQKKYLEIYNE